MLLGTLKYLKMPIISPGHIFVQKAFLLGFFSGQLIFGGAYYWKEFCVSKWVGLDKNSLKQYKNSLKQPILTVHGPIFGRAYYRKDFASQLLFGGGGYFREGLFVGGLVIGILRYIIIPIKRVLNIPW